VTPVWIDYDGTHVLFNTEQSRAKTRNLTRDPRVAVTVADAKLGRAVVCAEVRTEKKKRKLASR
jgi:putative heme iron utilization protein